MVKLGSVIDVIMGQAPPGSKCNKEGIGIPFVKAGEFSNITPIIREWTTDPKKFGEQGDVFLCVVGATCGKINLGTDCAIGRSVAALRPDTSAIDKKYLYYFMSKMIQILRKNSLGAAQTVISKDMINKIEIQLPPLSEQKQIVDQLDYSFVEINKLNNLNKDALRQKQTLEENFYKGFFKSLEEEYGMMKLEEGTQLISGQHIMSKDYNSNKDGMGYLTGPADFGNVSPVITKFTLKPKKTAIKNDILITLKGSGIGKVNIMDQNELAISRQLAAIRPIKFDPLYLFIFLKTKFSYFQKLGNGAAIPGLSRVDVQTLKVPRVPIATQRKVIEKFQKFQLLITRYETLQSLKFKELKSLKSSILSNELQN